MTIEQIILYLTPFAIWAAGWVVAKVKPLIPGWMMLAVVGVITGAYTFITQLATNPEIEWYLQLLYGLLAVVISQILKQFSNSKRSVDKAKV